MKRLVSIIAVLSLSICAFAQGFNTGGVKAKVVDRAGRAPIGNAIITLSTEEAVVATSKTDENGDFLLESIPNGRYRLTINAEDFTDATVNLSVENGFIRDLVMVTMTRSNLVKESDDAAISDFDMQDTGYSDNPTIIYSSYDPFTSSAGYAFSSVRFKNRGYNSESQEVLMAGVPMNDAVTGYAPFSLWSGLNEALRSRESTIGMEASDYATGGYNGVTNFHAIPSSARTGWRFSALTNSALYRLRLMASYATGVMDNGWSFSFNVSARLGGNDWVKGVYYNNYAFYAGAEKKFSPEHNLAFFAFATPGKRGMQNASTQEVYDLMGDNMYNSNWGYQNGKVRNSREKKSFEPVIGLKYDYTPTNRFRASATAIWITGYNASSAFDWYDAQDPRPDYYRNLPSYFSMEDDDYNRHNVDKSEWAEYAWTTRDGSCENYQHVNWDRLYQVNYNQVRYADGRSKYVVQDRRTDQNDISLAGNLRWRPSDRWTLSGGLNARYNRSEYYQKMSDLLGGLFYLDVDQFAEREFASTQAMIQNDLDYYIANNKARTILKGDKYGYDYLANAIKSRLWANGTYSIGGFSATLGANVGYTTFWRNGLVRKGMFAGLDDNGNPFYTRQDGTVYATDTPALTDELLSNFDSEGKWITSKGRSARARFLSYQGKLGLQYVFAGGHRVFANVGYFNDAPNFNQAFISARTRNSMVKDLKTVKTFSTDLNYHFNQGGWNARVSAFYTTIKDQTKVSSFYDDSQQSFTNFVMTGLDQRHMGVELGIRTPNIFIKGLTAGALFSFGEYIYTSNPHMVQTVDNSAKIIRDEEVPYWKSTPTANGEQKHYVASTPQLATQLALNYNVNYWYFEVNGQFFDRAYLDMNPLYRTAFACAGGDGVITQEEIEYMTVQEKFSPAFLLNASVGKSWRIHHKYYLGFSLDARNILNRKNVRTGGYEQTRLIKSSDYSRYYKFDPKYFYMSGASYMLNIYFRF